MHLMTGSAKLRRLMKRLEHRFLVERGLRLHQSIVDKLQNRVLAIGKGIMQRLFDHKVSVSNWWIIDMGNTVTDRTGNARLRGGIVD